MRILILGGNGFIGSALTREILATRDWDVVNLDLSSHRLEHFDGHRRFTFIRGDLRVMHDAVDRLIADCDVVLPLAAYTTPATYVQDPIGTFELDFEAMLRVVRMTAKTGRRLIFPSTSEVYGMCADESFDEEASQLVLGPIRNTRWIYACSKQLLDRVIWALGDQGLNFTIFRPFNWFGPGQDNFRDARPGSSRVIPQFIGHLLRGEPIQLVEGGDQCRTFTYIDDGIDALMHILDNEGALVAGQIFNIGNPANSISIRDLAEILIEEYAELMDRPPPPLEEAMVTVSGLDYYGKGYEDMRHRRPCIDRARRLGWSPQVELREGLRRILTHDLPKPASHTGADPRTRFAAAGGGAAIL